MDTANALLEAIRDDPDDDLSRLAYADWLMEQPSEMDQARGEFIQLQCRLAGVPSDDPALEEMRRRETELLATHRHSWLGELERFGECELVLGFARLTVLPAFRKRLADISCLPEWGLVMGLRVEKLTQGRLSELTTWPGLLDIPEIDLGQSRLTSMPAASFRQLLPVAASSRCCRLRLAGGFLGRAGLQQLMETPLASRLVRLALEDENLSDAGIACLTEARLPRLRDLSLAYNRIVASSTRLLAKLPRLRQLCLASNRFGPPGVLALARSPFLHLEELDLRHTGLGNEGAWALLAAPFLSRLRRLRLGGNAILDPGLLWQYREILGSRVEF